jgi:hypothetical protein
MSDVTVIDERRFPCVGPPAREAPKNACVNLPHCVLCITSRREWASVTLGTLPQGGEAD